MPIHTEIDKDTGIRRHTVTGDLTFATLKETLGTLYQSSEFQPDTNVLWDLRDAKQALTSKEVDRLADYVGGHWGTRGGSKAAIVVSRDVDFGMARMYEQLLAIHSSSVVMVFRELEDATSWLHENAESSGA